MSTTQLEFDIITINAQGQKDLHCHSKTQLFSENLNSGERIEMVAIPGGIFQMGSLETEIGRDKHESPRQSVKVVPFFMSKYPITQSLWRVVAALPQIKRPLDSDPSDFKGDNRPVERVSWYDAIEFCDRLTKQTGREYRLPTEAEWEYACRAGTATPFHFGDTITTELANYDGRFSYGSGPKRTLSSEIASFETNSNIFANGSENPSGNPCNPPANPSGNPCNPPKNPSGRNISSFPWNHQGEYRGQTTPVGIAQVPNDFGLYDMHGNVWEWCADHWHDNYEGAPLNASEWLCDNENQFRVLRGGSWSNYSEICRSASRNKSGPYDLSYYIGFRVAFTLR